MPSRSAVPVSYGPAARPAGAERRGGGLEVTRFEIDGPMVLRPRRFSDERGFVAETWSAQAFEAHIGRVRFVQENHALSLQAGTVRGLHFQIAPAAQGKLVRVVRGAIYDVAVDIRPGSATWGEHVAVILRPGDLAQIWVPAGFAHGICTLEPATEVVYKLSSPYSPAHERGIAWDDPSLAIDWPVARHSAILSPRDRALPLLDDRDAWERRALPPPAA
jgi:dTDP-4-dehydrorhamnose 3,5-epimerase